MSTNIGRERELQDAVNTLTIRAYRAEDRLDAVLAAARDWLDWYRKGGRVRHITEETLREAIEATDQHFSGPTNSDTANALIEATQHSALCTVGHCVSWCGEADLMSDNQAIDVGVSAEVRARMEADMADPEWAASMQRSLEDVEAGRVLPWRIAMLPLPDWLFHVLFHWIAPWTSGRRIRRAHKRTDTQLSEHDD